jgi:hypothetical protein
MSNIAKKNQFSDKQKVAIEYIAANPGITNKELATLIKSKTRTVSGWRTNVKFIDAIYDRFMEVTGRELPALVLALIEEGKQGNVKAIELALKHFGKFQDSVTIKIESPFMQHLKASEITQDNFVDAEFSVVTDEPIELPPRNQVNNRPNSRTMKENIKVKDIKKKNGPKHKKYLKDLSARRKLVKRAKAVNLEPLPAGRPTEAARRKWMDKLEKLEKNNRE